MPPIYLDYNASTPLDPQVAAAMMPYLSGTFGNPSSSHAYGKQAAAAVERAREQVAALLGAKAHEVIFTSGGSEANNLAIKGYVWANRDRGNHLITTAVEHPAVLEVCRYLERQGFQSTYLPVDEFGMVHVDEVQRALTDKTILISIMHANNEVGTLQPITEIARIAHEKGIAVHCDVAQSVGKVRVRFDELGADMISVAGHKFYAPKGIGALLVREGIKLEKLIHGAGHESGRRAGTENVMAIVGLGRACEIAARDLERNTAHMKSLRDRLRDLLSQRVAEVRFNGHPAQCLPNTLSASFRNVPADRLLASIGNELAVSAGAACHSHGVSVSHVLSAMNVPADYAMGTLRISVGKMTTMEEVDRAVEILVGAVQKDRGLRS